MYSEFINILRIESNAIEKSLSNIDKSQVNNIIEKLLACTGKVILLGVGKSYIIGQKIAATMTSTGTLAVNLHAADALHGDLGLVTSDDVCIILSYSGETEEILNIVPHIKHRKVTIVSIVGNMKSSLARESDYSLNASIDKEACPLNLAPTASTTLTLAIGDALAMTLMKRKGLSKNDFAFNHPAGRLGKRLTLLVKNLMIEESQTPSIDAGASFFEAVAAISSGGVGAVNVIDSQKLLLGIITDGDIRRTLQLDDISKLTSLSAQEVMTKEPVTIAGDTLAFDALRIMENRKSQISVLPVVDENRCAIGILRLHDLVRAGL